MGTRRWARPLLVVYLLLLGLVVLAPTSDVQSGLLVRVLDEVVRLAPFGAQLTFDRLEVLANVAMVVPAGALAALSFPRLRWQDWAAYGFLVALAVELVQGFVLPARQASATDVVANALGALVGALLVRVLRGVVRRTRRG